MVITLNFDTKSKVFLFKCISFVSDLNYLLFIQSGLKDNFLVYLQISFAGKIFPFPLVNWWEHYQIIFKCLGDMDDSNSQAFASGYFHTRKCILWVCER